MSPPRSQRPAPRWALAASHKRRHSHPPSLPEAPHWGPLRPLGLFLPQATAGMTDRPSDSQIDYSPILPRMIMDLLEHGHLLTALELAQAAQEARHFAGLSQQEAARKLGVAQATLAQAESAPKRSLQALRTRMVAELSAGMEVSGPYFVVKRRSMSLRDGDYFR